MRQKTPGAYSCLCRGVLGVFIILLITLSALGDEVNYVLGNDAIEQARAGSGVASPRSAAWMLLNPAGLTQLERRYDFSVGMIVSDIILEPGGLIGNRFDAPLKSDRVGIAPTGGFVFPLSTGTLGLGMYAPIGGRTAYKKPRNVLERILPRNADRRLEYIHTKLALAYAYEFENGWSAGIAVHGSLTGLRTDHYIPDLRPTSGGHEWEKVLGFGFGLGVYRAWDRFAVGAAYTSRHWTEAMERYGDIARHHTDLPQMFQAGIAYKVRPDLEFTADYRFVKWSEMAFFGEKPQRYGLNWGDQQGIRIGVEWKSSPRLSLMAGFAHMNSPIDRNNVFTNGLVPVVSENHATTGFDFLLNEQVSMQLTYQRSFKKQIEDTGKGGFFSFFARGTRLQGSADVVRIGLTYRF